VQDSNYHFDRNCLERKGGGKAKIASPDSRAEKTEVCGRYRNQDRGDRRGGKKNDHQKGMGT